MDIGRVGCRDGLLFGYIGGHRSDSFRLYVGQKKLQLFGHAELGAVAAFVFG
jgi:hypothetical protein